MFFCCSVATISGDSAFIALPYCRLSVSQPASATTAQSAADASKPRAVRSSFKPHAPRRAGRKRSRPYYLSVILKDAAITRQRPVWPQFQHAYGERKVNRGQTGADSQAKAQRFLPILR